MGTGSSVLQDRVRPPAPNGDRLIPFADVTKRLCVLQNCNTGQVIILVDHKVLHQLDVVPDPQDWFEVPIAQQQKNYFDVILETKVLTVPPPRGGSESSLNVVNASALAAGDSKATSSSIGRPPHDLTDPYGSFRAVSYCSTFPSLASSLPARPSLTHSPTHPPTHAS